jgi:TPR repeat protein
MSPTTDIVSMSYRDLQRACKEAGLPAGGKAENLQRSLQEKRSSEEGKEADVGAKEENDPTISNKKLKRSALQEFKCPISHELPIDPVMATDGKIYERECIEKWLEDKNTSPVTRAIISKVVTASSAVKNAIESLVESSEDRPQDEKDLAAVWKRRMEEKKKMDALIKKAESGDVTSMEKLGSNYQGGLDGFDQDKGKAYIWNKCAADKGSIIGLYRSAQYLLKGKPKRSFSAELQGVSLMSLAATEKGSDFACLKLGIWYARGCGGLPKDKGQAVRLLELGLSGKCQHVHAKQSTVDDATKTLQELTEDAG